MMRVALLSSLSSSLAPPLAFVSPAQSLSFPLWSRRRLGSSRTPLLWCNSFLPISFRPSTRSSTPHTGATVFPFCSRPLGMEKLLSCPICRDPFTQAVEVQCCSKCYCLKCIEQWITDSSKGDSSTCPNCRSPLLSGQWKENRPLQALADDLPALCKYVSNGVRTINPY